MDPDSNLEEQLGLADELSRDPSDLDASCRLAELVLALNEWILSGGALPEKWEVF